MTIELLNKVPSKKNSRRIFRRRGRTINIPSLNYEKFKDEAIKQIQDQIGIFAEITGNLSVEYTFYMKGKARSDVDNMVASINDILQDSGLIEDDNNILKINAQKVPLSPEYKTIVSISKFS